MNETSSTPTSAPPAVPPQEKPKSDMWKRKIGSFWTKTGRATGEKFLSGELEFMQITGKPDRVQVILIKNNKKRMEKHPDWELFLSQKEMAKGVEFDNPVKPQENLPDLSSL